MSAFLVSRHTINRIVAVLSSLLRTDRYAWVDSRFVEAGYDPTEANWEERLARAMFQLNQAALSQRYGDPAAEHFVYARVKLLPSLYQTLKSLHCWLYQCSEGDVPQRELYRFFDTVVRVWLLEIIVSRLPEYEQAEWG